MPMPDNVGRSHRLQNIYLCLEIVKYVLRIRIGEILHKLGTLLKQRLDLIFLTMSACNDSLKKPVK
ncbi:hypothetical protein JSE7799_03255 [Jannaschia seosinensis]|uniref:Uncharacterized protein n=2 Tax=Jannaschia seosinensis TaxID=313367 RepID=A0A0M7BDP3_9RHOB|nr:hypothetical protein JSE7799_03255 [Jannaschia seosinensis]